MLLSRYPAEILELDAAFSYQGYSRHESEKSLTRGTPDPAWVLCRAAQLIKREIKTKRSTHREEIPKQYKRHYEKFTFPLETQT